VVVTGAGSGIGRAAALVCAREGARVGVLDLDAAAAERTVSEVAGASGEALSLVADLTDEAQVEAAVREASQAWGGLDCVIGCAGVQLAGLDDRADRLSLEVWRRTIDVNLTGMFLISKHGIRELLKVGGGTVVLVCSPTGLFGCAPGYDAYSSSKAGVYGLVRVMAADYGADNIRVNGVIPGYTRTPMTAWVSGDQHDALLQTIPLGRGAVWSADGGMTAI
jgi:NAD(P)-dependent dehydrogenase (short-subunit alcohol dehydrogenase family)